MHSKKCLKNKQTGEKIMLKTHDSATDLIIQNKLLTARIFIDLKAILYCRKTLTSRKQCDKL